VLLLLASLLLLGFAAGQNLVAELAEEESSLMGELAPQAAVKEQQSNAKDDQAEDAKAAQEMANVASKAKVEEAKRVNDMVKSKTAKKKVAEAVAQRKVVKEQLALAKRLAPKNSTQLANELETAFSTFCDGHSACEKAGKSALQKLIKIKKGPSVLPTSGSSLLKKAQKAAAVTPKAVKALVNHTLVNQSGLSGMIEHKAGQVRKKEEKLMARAASSDTTVSAAKVIKVKTKAAAQKGVAQLAALKVKQAAEWKKKETQAARAIGEAVVMKKQAARVLKRARKRAAEKEAKAEKVRQRAARANYKAKAAQAKAEAFRKKVGLELTVAQLMAGKKTKAKAVPTTKANANMTKSVQKKVHAQEEKLEKEISSFADKAGGRRSLVLLSLGGNVKRVNLAAKLVAQIKALNGTITAAQEDLEVAQLHRKQQRSTLSKSEKQAFLRTEKQALRTIERSRRKRKRIWDQVKRMDARRVRKNAARLKQLEYRAKLALSSAKRADTREKEATAAETEAKTQLTNATRKHRLAVVNWEGKLQTQSLLMAAKLRLQKQAMRAVAQQPSDAKADPADAKADPAAATLEAFAKAEDADEMAKDKKTQKKMRGAVADAASAALEAFSKAEDADEMEKEKPDVAAAALGAFGRAEDT